MTAHTTRRPGQLATEREKSVERAIDDLFTVAGFRPIRFSQARATQQTPGIPDRRYVSRGLGLALWFEVKAEDGEWEDDQRAFAADCAMTEEVYVVGGRDEAYAVLAALDLWDGSALRVGRGPVLPPGDPYRTEVHAVARASRRRWSEPQAGRLTSFRAFVAHTTALAMLTGRAP